MKKVLLLLLAGLMAFFGVSVKAMADARIDSLGADVREVEDLDLMWLYPNKVLDYKNTADFRLGALTATGQEWGGIIKDMNDMGMGTLAAYVHRPTTQASVAGGQLTTGGTNTLVGKYWGAVGGPLASAAQKANNDLDLIWGTDLSGASLGIHLGYSDMYYGAGSLNSDVTAIQLGAGLGFAPGGSFSQGNIYAEFDTLSGAVGGSITDIKAGTLWQNDINADNDLRVSADVELDSASASQSALAGLVGLSCNHKVNGGKGLVSSGLFFDYGNVSNAGGVSNANFSSYTWAWNGNVEAQAYDWLTVRTGISKVLYNRLNGPAPTWLQSNAAAGASYNVGFTVNWNNFAVNTKVTTGSFETAMSPNPGNGIFYGGPILVAAQTDIDYKF